MVTQKKEQPILKTLLQTEVLSWTPGVKHTQAQSWPVGVYSQSNMDEMSESLGKLQPLIPLQNKVSKRSLS